MRNSSAWSACIRASSRANSTSSSTFAWANEAALAPPALVVAAGAGATAASSPASQADPNGVTALSSRTMLSRPRACGLRERA